MIANAHRGTPIHLLWTREEDFIGTTYRAMGVARLRAALDADGWPIALDVRTAMQDSLGKRHLWKRRQGAPPGDRSAPLARGARNRRLLRHQR